MLEIGYREGDRKIFYKGGLLGAGYVYKVPAPKAANVVKSLPSLLVGVSELEVSPFYGYDLAIITPEVLNVRLEFDPITKRHYKRVNNRL